MKHGDESNVDKRQCQAETQSGRACKAPPLKDGKFCISHSDRKTRESAGFLAANGKQGRPRNPRVSEVLKQRVETHADEILAVYFEAVKATAPDGRPDHAIRLRAADALLDRCYGKSKQATEINVSESQPIEQVSVPTDAEFQRQVAAVLADAGAVTGEVMDSPGRE